jgi:hypothetical protein
MKIRNIIIFRKYSCFLEITYKYWNQENLFNHKIFSNIHIQLILFSWTYQILFFTKNILYLSQKKINSLDSFYAQFNMFYWIGWNNKKINRDSAFKFKVTQIICIKNWYFDSKARENWGYHEKTIFIVKLSTNFEI